MSFRHNGGFCNTIIRNRMTFCKCGVAALPPRTSCKQSAARPASLGRWPVGRLFTTLRASVLCRALQTFRATRSMFTTLLAGIRHSLTHTYARSLVKMCFRSTDLSQQQTRTYANGRNTPSNSENLVVRGCTESIGAPGGTRTHTPFGKGT